MTRHDNESNPRWIAAQRAKGAAWVNSLSRSDVFELGDAFVLGSFDWRDWLTSKPSAAFLRGAEYAWQLREETN